MWQPPSDLGPILDWGQQLKTDRVTVRLLIGNTELRLRLSLLFHNGWPGQALVLCQDNFIRFTAGRGIYSKHRPSHHTSHMSHRSQVNVGSEIVISRKTLWETLMSLYSCSTQCSNLMRILTNIGITVIIC